MKVTQMPPVHAANLVANSGNTAYGADVIIQVQHSKYHGYWCPASFCRQDISTHDIDYIKWMSF